MFNFELCKPKMRNICMFFGFHCKCFFNTSPQPLSRRTIQFLPRNKTSSLFNKGKQNIASRETLRILHTSSKKLEKTLESNNNGKEKNLNSVIYYGPLTGKIKGVKFFTCSSSLAGILLQPIIIQNIANGDKLPLNATLYTGVVFFTFVTPFLIHLLTKKYVTEIRYNSTSNTYTATTLSFFLQRINVEFTIEDVTVPNILPLFTTMSIKGKPVFVISDSFLEIEHYIKMMKYDKPIDLKLGTTPVASEKDERN